MVALNAALGGRLGRQFAEYVFRLGLVVGQVASGLVGRPNEAKLTLGTHARKCLPLRPEWRQREGDRHSL